MVDTWTNEDEIQLLTLQRKKMDYAAKRKMVELLHTAIKHLDKGKHVNFSSRVDLLDSVTRKVTIEVQYYE